MEDVIILGAGASGMMCALEAGKRKKKVVLIDHSPQAGKKISLSGGGQCNFTHRRVSFENYVSQNPKFVTSALRRFPPEKFLERLQEHNISFHEPKPNQFFCRGSAHQIVSMLQNECEKENVRFCFQEQVRSVQKLKTFRVQTQQKTFEAPSLVVATGGLSFPRTGASGIGYEIAKQFSHSILPLRPALVGFTFPSKEQTWFSELSGISLEVEIKISRHSFRDRLLFTHFGLSGPSIFQTSLYWNPGEPFEINFAPGKDLPVWLLAQKKNHPKKQLKNTLGQIFPLRFCEKMNSPFNVTQKSLQEISNLTLQKLGQQLSRWVFIPKDTLGYEKAEVTRGGVNTFELSSKTMESKFISGLFFVGEVVDVTGQLGGFNLHWAWASGSAAGQFV